MLIVIYLVIVVGVFYWQVKSVKAGKSAKVKAIGWYFVYTVAPILCYGLVFMALVGVEELTGAAIIAEEYARSLIFVIVGGISLALFGTLIFSVAVIFINNDNANAA